MPTDDVEQYMYEDMDIDDDDLVVDDAMEEMFNVVVAERELAIENIVCTLQTIILTYL